MSRNTGTGTAVRIVDEFSVLKPATEAHSVRGGVAAFTVHLVVSELPPVHVPVLVRVPAIDVTAMSCEELYVTIVSCAELNVAIM